MSRMKIVQIKDASGNELNAIRFGAKILSLSPKPLELNNEKKTKYRLATIQYINDREETKQGTALIFEKNVDYGIKTNKIEYMATATIGKNAQGEQRLYVQMSHLPHGAGSINLEDLGDFDMAALMSTTNVAKTAEEVDNATN